ncbi:MAG: alpha/beta hydrolase [Marinobacter sp.]|uniref:alpha/beta fold hydrolase n=1 Tax=Marinobacter sp. TaxID=50741 RepID=UPI0034A041C6
MTLGQSFESRRFLAGKTGINVTLGGSGPPLLLLHGYPETHAMWHRVAPTLARQFHVVCPDLRGYGDSDKPGGLPDHSNYSKRAMAQDMVEVMTSLGYDEFMIAGHDRGARVTHRMALDHPERVQKACIMDIAPTLHMFRHTDQNFATGYYHWFFLIQPDGLPEHLIGADPGYYLTEKLKRWSAPAAEFSEEVVAEYVRCFSQPDAIHASCEDYRAAATIDLEHDKHDIEKKIQCPLLVLWGSQGFVNRTYNVLEVWRERGMQVQGKALDCGHFLPEEVPEAVVAELLAFFKPVHE